MSQDLALKPVSSLSADWSSNREQIELLKRTICKDSTDDEFQLFIHVAKRSGLDPFARQIHAVQRWSSKMNRYEMSIQVGIDGFRLIADRTGVYAGSDDPVFDNEKAPTKATVTVYKIVQGVRCPFTATARWTEYWPGEKLGFMWKNKPCLMLSKCAESLALRKAFPAELSGLYTNEEMEQANKNEPVVGSARIAPGEPGENDGVPFDDGKYLIPGGTYSKRTIDQVLRDIGPQALEAYVNRQDERWEKTPEKKPEWWDDFAERVVETIADLQSEELK